LRTWPGEHIEQHQNHGLRSHIKHIPYSHRGIIHLIPDDSTWVGTRDICPSRSFSWESERSELNKSSSPKNADSDRNLQPSRRNSIEWDCYSVKHMFSFSTISIPSQHTSGARKNDNVDVKRKKSMEKEILSLEHKWFPTYLYTTANECMLAVLSPLPVPVSGYGCIWIGISRH
jgi:hypothetical protein